MSLRLKIYRQGLMVEASKYSMLLWQAYQFMCSLDHKDFWKQTKENIRQQVHAMIVPLLAKEIAA